MITLLLGLALPSSVLAAMYVYSLFEPLEAHKTGRHPLDVVAGDINSDGLNDVVTANRDGASLSIFMGNGDGTLTEINPVQLKQGATSLALGDLSGDKIPDVALTACDAYCNHNGVLILRGLGDGRFERETYIPVDGVPYNLAIADLNADGSLDMVASDAPNDRIIILLRIGSGWEFSAEHSPTGDQPIALTLGDVNHDGIPDLMANAHWDDVVTLHIMSAHGAVERIVEIPTEDLPYSIALGLINQDDHADLIVGHSSEPGRILIFYGNGQGEFERAQEIETVGRLIYVASGDFNLDGRTDLIATRHKETFTSVYLQDQQGRFEIKPFSLPSSNRIYSLALTELNGDEIPDLVTVDYEDDALSVSIGAAAEP